jgi:hypothetical protein
VPITIQTPASGGPLGIGMTSTVTADITLFADNDFLEIELKDNLETGHLVGYGSARTLHSPTADIVIGRTVQGPTTNWQAYPQWPTSAHLAPMFMRVVHKSSAGTQKDALAMPIAHDTITGLTVALPALMPITTPAGGFIQSDRDTLELVLNSVWRSFPPATPGGTSVSMAAIDVLRGPPRSFLRRFGSVFISGQGALSAVPPGGFHSFGGTWSIQTLPPQLGVDHGIVFEYHRRLAQFVVLRDEPTSDLYVDVLEDSHWSDNFILWQFPNPIQIQYDVAPGVVLIWNWLV